jgi:hypothetical protein
VRPRHQPVITTTPMANCPATPVSDSGWKGSAGSRPRPRRSRRARAVAGSARAAGHARPEAFCRGLGEVGWKPVRRDHSPLARGSGRRAVNRCL